MSLTSQQRRYLKSLAHHLDPVVRIGRSRVSPAVVSETDRALESHELIKIKVDSESPEERRQAAESLAAGAGGELVGTIGKIAILYRRRKEKPTIKLPESS